eukprot:scaffold1088_cov247-Pinguiococcus_pyrenoidosus.AAC.14
MDGLLEAHVGHEVPHLVGRVSHDQDGLLFQVCQLRVQRVRQHHLLRLDPGHGFVPGERLVRPQAAAARLQRPVELPRELLGILALRPAPTSVGHEDVGNAVLLQLHQGPERLLASPSALLHHAINVLNCKIDRPGHFLQPLRIAEARRGLQKRLRRSY